MDLVKKRAELLALHKIYEQVPESPWHPSHPTMRGETPLSQRPIAFICDDRIILVDGCVDALVDMAHAFEAHINQAIAEYDLPQTNEEAWALHVCSRLQRDGSGRLVLGTRDWNGLMYAAKTLNFKVILTDGSCAPSSNHTATPPKSDPAAKSSSPTSTPAATARPPGKRR